MTVPSVSVQAGPEDRTSWLALARRVEELGFDGLYAADHPGAGPAPFVALAAAAAVTDRIRLGTCVVNAGRWEPLALAAEVATLDVVSGGRATLGVGAGHTPAEWTATGRPFPSPGQRVDRMVELVHLTRALLAGGTVTHRGRHLTLVDAELADPRPVQDPVPVLVGGNGARVLDVAARTADVVGVTGLARTLADGHHHEVDWSPAATARRADLVATAAADAGRTPHVEALVQHVEVTDDAAAAATRLAPLVPGATVDDLLDTPFAWIGTVAEIRGRLDAHRERYGIERYVVRPPAVPDVALVLPTGTGEPTT